MRERVGILDLGGFTKLIVEGAGAEAWLDRLVCGRLPRQGRIALTWTLNPKGGILSEFTITRLAPERFLLISAAAAEWHDLDGLHAHLPADGSVRIENVTARYGSLILAGPRARDSARQGHRGGSLQRRLSLAERARDRDRLCAGCWRCG